LTGGARFGFGGDASVREGEGPLPHVPLAPMIATLPGFAMSVLMDFVFSDVHLLVIAILVLWPCSS